MPETVPIPSPPGLPLLGNIADIDSELPVKSFSHLADIYGSFFYFAKGVAEVLDDLLKAILLWRYLVFTMDRTNSNPQDRSTGSLLEGAAGWSLAHKP